MGIKDDWESEMQYVLLRFGLQNDYRTKEAYKTLRTNIELSGSDIKTIAITSCTPNEGKSSVAMELAKAFAEAGKNTVLVDGDLRKSVLVGRYKTGAVGMGLTHALIGRAELKNVICTTNISNLHVIFSGPVPPNPSELLGNVQFQTILQELRERYDYVIVDTPPLGSVIDAAVIARQCDGTMLVIESNAISYRFAQRVKDQLSKTESRILGVVLNKVDMSAKGYYGHYGRYYGKYYGKYYGRYGEESISEQVEVPVKEKKKKETVKKVLREVQGQNKENGDLEYL